MPPWSNPVRMPPRHGGGPRSNRGGGVWVGGRRAMRPSAERDDAGASPARSMPQWLKGRSACVVNRRMPVRFRPAAHGRVAQRTEHLSSKERDAGSTPAASAPLSSTGEDGFSRRSRRRFDSVQGHRWACGVMDSTRAFEARRSGFDSSHARRFDSRDETPIYPVPSGFGSQ